MSVKGVHYVKHLEERLAQREQVLGVGLPFVFLLGIMGHRGVVKMTSYLSEEQVAYCSPSVAPQCLQDKAGSWAASALHLPTHFSSPCFKTLHAHRLQKLSLGR